MKISKIQWAVHGIVTVVFAVVVTIVWLEKDFQFWCFGVSTLLTIINSLILCGLIGASGDGNSAPLDQSLFVPPVVAYLAIILVTVKGADWFNYKINPYLAVHIVIFALSALVQILLIHSRKGNMQQEQFEKISRYERDELAESWKKIGQFVQADGELKALANKVEGEIRYADPIPSAGLAGMENQIQDYTERLFASVRTGDYSAAGVKGQMEEIYDLVVQYNRKRKALK
jgi:hypothetical protein